MEANFTFDEAVYNEILQGKKLYHIDDPETPYIIAYVKVNKKLRQIKVHCTNGQSFLADQDEIFTWEVNTPLEDKPITKRKNKKKGK